MLSQQSRYLHFNSTMVRLKEGGYSYHQSDFKAFQFHYGSVKRIEEISGMDIEHNFNSTMVRLKELNNLQ